jgi:glucoamylase
MWRFNHKIRHLPAGKMLRIEALAATCIHWSADDWNSAHDLPSHDPGLGVHIADLPTQALAEGARIRFTFHWLEADRWEGADFLVLIGPPS